MSRAPRVVVTGVGVVSAWGWGLEPFAAGLDSGETAIGDFTRVDHTAYRTHVAGEVPAPPPELPASVPGWRRMAWADRFAAAAAREALAQAGLSLPLTVGGSPAAEATGVFFGSSTGGMLEGEEWYVRVSGHGGDENGEGDAANAPPATPAKAPLNLLVHQQVSSPGETVARMVGCGGPVETVSSACASGTLALGRALEALRSGEVEMALAGGSDSLCRVTYGGFNSLRSVDEAPCRPFRTDRAGLSIGEGGAVLVLETEAAAARRGARPLAVVAGASATGDATHMTAPHPQGEGAARALDRALADAGLSPAEVAFINAHGTGTPLNDAAEGRALEAVFGGAARGLPLAATKASVGHLLGSAGAVEAVATLLTLLDGRLPPTPGGGDVDPEIGIDLVLDAPRAVPGDGACAAVSLNLAFGGCNAAVVFTPSPAASPRSR